MSVETFEPRVLLAAADLDPTFGIGGVVRTDLSGGGYVDQAADAVVQSDGKVVIGGTAGVRADSSPGGVFAVARYNLDGSPDRAFGDGGITRTVLSRGGRPALLAHVEALALQRDGKIVAGGYVLGSEPFQQNFDFALARYNPDGSLDASFGDGGTVVLDYSPPFNFGATSDDRINDLAIQGDGKIVAAGSGYTGVGHVAIARFNPDGSLDAGFGNGGKLAARLGDASSASAVALLADGKILVAGTAETYPPSVALSRYNPDGTPDPTFGAGIPERPDLVGVTIDRVGWADVDDLAVDPRDGSLYVAARLYVGTVTDPSTFHPPTSQVLKYTPDGRRVTGFGDNGLLYISKRGDGFLGRRDALAVQGDGNVIVATTSGDGHRLPTPPEFSWTLARFTPEGALDLSFAPGGRVESAAAGNWGMVSKVVVLPGGAVLAVGSAGRPGPDPDGSDALLARFRGGADPVAGVGILAGTLFTDADRDGRREALEAPVEGQSVYLDVNDDNVHSPLEPVATSGPDGRYTFSGLPAGRYVLRPLLSGVWHQSSPPPEGTAIVRNLPAGGGLGGIDFGLVQLPKISAFAFNDANVNGTYDAGEQPLAGLMIYIDADNDGLPGGGETAATTGADGVATFVVTPGSYRLRQYAGGRGETVPAQGSYLVTAGGEDMSGPIFGSVSASDIAFIDGITYSDVNGNGTKESSEPGLPGNVVYLDADNDGVLDPAERTSVSDWRGFYEFGLLLPGTYTVRLRTPPGQHQTGPAGGAPYVVTVRGGSRLHPNFGFQLDPRQVLGRHLFYNNSAYDGRDPAANSGDDAAVAPDKQALSPGQAWSFANVTSSPRGITGVMIDVNYLRADAAPAPWEFDVAVASSPTSSTWAPGPSPATVGVRVGAGDGGSDRVTLTWPDGAIVGKWVKLTVYPARTIGLPAQEVFLFGSLPGETGDAGSPLRVSALDLGGVKRVLNSRADPASPFDVNRDGRVNALDLAVVKANLGRSLVASSASASIVLPPALGEADESTSRVWDEVEVPVLSGRVG